MLRRDLLSKKFFEIRLLIIAFVLHIPHQGLERHHPTNPLKRGVGYTAESPTPVYPPVDPAIHTLGYKKYEITNYLGNVNAVITDRKVYVSGTYEAVVIGIQAKSPKMAVTWQESIFRFLADNDEVRAREILFAELKAFLEHQIKENN